MTYLITSEEIKALTTYAMLGGVCMSVCGFAAPAGHPLIALVALAATGAILVAYARLTYRIMVERGSVQDVEAEEEPTR